MDSLTPGDRKSNIPKNLTELRSLPSVDKLLQTDSASQWIADFGRPLTLLAMRTALDEIRSTHVKGAPVPSHDTLLQNAYQMLKHWISVTLQPVINATGVILHTNLGRAPLSQSALQAIQDVSAGYSSLEYNLKGGKRGSRASHTGNLLKRLTGAEASLIVNNNASAVLLILSALARRRRVLIPRSQLVEIGGGFRIPDVMKQSGAKLVEIGTTNRVYISDYQQALSEQPIALVMHAHRSNFQIIGFTNEPDLVEIVSTAHEANLPLVHDLGSGSLLDTSRFGLGHEPMVQESLAAGVDLVCFSGDKLLGGPQAGVILGRADLIAKLSKHPLARAIRADKLCLAALSATLLHYLKDEAEQEVPIWRMISMSPDTISLRASNWQREIGRGVVIEGRSTVGGGSLPEETLPTSLLALPVATPDRILASLRQFKPPIIARIQEDMVVFDPRSVLIEQDNQLLAGINTCIQ